jgi:hypothetical protein
MKLRVLALIVSGTAGLWACEGGQAATPRAPTSGPPSDTKVHPELAPVPTPSGDIEFRSALDLRQVPVSGAADLRGGREAVSSEWPASSYATFAARDVTAACTAALIGPSVLLTAAHCVPAAGGVTLAYEGHAKPYVATCTRHPDYGSPAKDASADFALCVVKPAFSAASGFRYETVSTASMSALVNRTVVLAGFGCVSSVAASASFDGKYRIGISTIDESSASSARTRGDAFYAPRENNNLFTAADPAHPNFCPGDSGGPVFAGTPGAPDLTARTIVGINSRVFRDASGTGFGSSIISATGGPAFHGWAVQWARQAGVAACGIAGLVANCRG